ncbi:MAG: photosystem reaction center subunit H [Cereibacter sphaeroides]|uniref:Photosystem reaction center subunit H n=1 Tax=Cereibacter sphaeroides TaxID=1063 RepID=A0A2W5SFG4_CERSP|nr:MAG: photosystem reaction center subunit H [Cereibacter sphaeroides]
MDHSLHTPIRPEEMTEAVLANAPIYGANDETVGRISHLHGSDVIVDVGGFLGIGAKPVLMSRDKIQFMRDEDGTVHGVTSWTKAQLRDLPEHRH